MILDTLVAGTRLRVEALKARTTLRELEEALEGCRPTRPFASALRHPGRLGLIAEIKKASPSKGLIAPNFDAGHQAELYRDTLADCLSVLTEPDHFLGALQDLTTAGAVAGKPCLRKDFIIDEIQVVEARLAGADCILLIASILKDWELRQLKAAALRLGMDVLIEVHNEEEARRAVASGATFIGINNRDLQTFQVNLSTTERLRALLPATATVVAESGVFTRADAHRLRDAGANAILVGESLMRSGEDVAGAIVQLLT
jgi:indole-3-glycerol phosphate synthase